MNLMKEETFWTVDCQLVHSAERLVREANTNSTVIGIIEALGDKAQVLPTGAILYNMDASPALRKSVESEFDPLQVNASESLRRADIQWGAKTPNKWIRMTELLNNINFQASSPLNSRLIQYMDQVTQRNYSTRRMSAIQPARLWLAAPDVSFNGIDSYCGISSHYRTLLRGDLKITAFLRNLALNAQDDGVWRRLVIFTTLFAGAADLGSETATTFVGAQLRRISGDLGEDITQEGAKFIDALSAGPVTVFDTSVWNRRDQEFS
jgi:hypothetical protein